ncbi:MAG: hypothetical protein NZ805_02705 [Armatimonadetes bacterium]|nr:hypothetical protein [Armatimonadota bacterium]MDW8028794.1 hypothetical protein [Armatimonadota bacterium]
MKQFDGLTSVEQKAVRQYLMELKRRFPEIARTAYPHRTRDDIIYIRADLPNGDDELMRVREVMLPVATDITVKHKVVLVLVPKLPWEYLNLKSASQTKRKRRANKKEQI